jgi:glycosyltransferase involved in cell wall biosynthesis
MTLLQSAKGRARQMNTGAAHATGDYICFLHADSRPCKDVVAVVRCARTPGLRLSHLFFRHGCCGNDPTPRRLLAICVHCGDVLRPDL